MALERPTEPKSTNTVEYPMQENSDDCSDCDCDSSDDGTDEYVASRFRMNTLALHCNSTPCHTTTQDISSGDRGSGGSPPLRMTAMSKSPGGGEPRGHNMHDMSDLVDSDDEDLRMTKCNKDREEFGSEPEYSDSDEELQQIRALMYKRWNRMNGTATPSPMEQHDCREPLFDTGGIPQEFFHAHTTQSEPWQEACWRKDFDVDGITEETMRAIFGGNLWPLELDEDEEVNALPSRPVIKVAIDSGAADHVINPDDVPGHTVVPSAGSKAGKHFLAAGGHRIPNQGQLNLMVSGEGFSGRVKSTFQAAPVTRPLLSVSKICDSGCKVLFDKERAIIRKDGRNVGTFVRRGGLYVAELAVQDPDRPADFPRPGVNQ